MNTNFVDDLELVLNRAKEVGTLGPHSCEVLVKYRVRLLAAVRLAEASVFADKATGTDRYRARDLELEAEVAYRAAMKETPND